MAYIFRDILLALKNKGKKKRSEDFFRSFTSCPIRVYEKDSKVITSWYNICINSLWLWSANYGLLFMSGYQDSNLGPPAPKAGALTGLRYTPFCNFFYFWLRRKGRYFFLTTKYLIVFFIYVHSHQFRRSLQHVYPLYQLLEWTYCKPICYISNDKTKFKIVF